MKGSFARRNRATALLVVLACLALLSTLAVSFARLTSLEGSASSSRVEEVRARLLAFAGMERAVAEIRQAAQRPYDGPDVPWFYRAASGLPSGNGEPISDAAIPSYEVGGLAQGRPYSGSLPDTYESLGDTYVLKILDAASMIDLNAPADPRRADADQPLVRMLVNLARGFSPAPISQAEAEMIFAYRQALPDQVFHDRRELLDIPGTPVTEAEFAVLADFVTTHAWADPFAVATMDPSLVPAVGADVFGRVPTGTVLRLARRPVNVNTAPPEVLAAVLAGLSAFRVDPDVPRTPAGGAKWQSRGLGARTTPVSYAQAIALAGAIVTKRETQPFRHWADFEAFLATQVAGSAVDALQAATIRANVDPNVNTNRANPDRVVWKEIDKFDLVASTTEFCFSSGGVFEIESIGRVTHLGGRILSQARIHAAIECFRLARHTVQSQFALGTGGGYTLIEPILYHPESAIIAQENLTFNGGPQIQGQAGSVHSNTDLDLGGNPFIEDNATASGSYSASNQAVVGGQSGGGFPNQLIPNFNAAMFRNQADYVFESDGKVYQGGTEVGQSPYLGFTYDPGNNLWSWNGGSQTPGILWFNSHVRIQSNTNQVWQVTLITTKSITIRGKPNMSPSRKLRLTVIAETDVTISGTPGAQISGVIYAGEQMDLGGNTSFYGAALARGNGAGDGTVTAPNKVHGSVVFIYNKDIDPIPYDWVHTPLPTVVTYPEPSAIANVGGNPVDLRMIADYDGWFGLAPVTVNRSYLGGVPLTDRLAARWKDGTLDSELGEGSPTMVLDQAGPIVGPLVGPSLMGHLMPDGCYSEWDSVGAYEATDNVGPIRGTIAFWVKPSWDAATTNRTHHLLGMSRTDDVGTQSFQFARVGSWSGSWDGTAGFHFERSTLENNRAERLVHSTWAPPAHRWTHVALVYDFTQSDYRLAIKVYVDGVEMPGSIYEFTDNYMLDPNEQARSAITPANLLRLGERIATAGSQYQLPGSSAEATFDELFCHRIPVDSTWAASMYGEGRFFSTEAADYLSTPLTAIPPGAELLHATWTVRTPAGWNGPAPTLRVEEAGTPIATTTDPVGASIGRVATGELRYRVVFLAGGSAQPFYEVPVIDDVTVAFVGEARVLNWEE